MRTQFLEFRKRAKKSRTKNLTIYYEPSTNTQLAVVVPKKSLKKATARNALKRLLKKSLLDHVRNSVVVVTAHPHAIDKNNLEEVANQLTNKLKKLNV